MLNILDFFKQNIRIIENYPYIGKASSCIMDMDYQSSLPVNYIYSQGKNIYIREFPNEF